MNLYWVTTEDHAEDWFIVANNRKEAATFHEEMEGYDPGDATAEMILELPDGVTANNGWPSEDVLQSCGANILLKGPTGERKFCEGLMESTGNTRMANRRASPRNLSIPKKFNRNLSYRVGEVRELTLKGSLTSPTSLLRMVPEV